MALVLSPCTAGLDKHIRFHQFVAGLVYDTEVNNVMNLCDDDAFLINEKKTSSILGKKMFIRPVYLPLADLIDQGTAADIPVVITGTSGVGKTMMRNWYTKQLLFRPFGPEDAFRTVILRDSDTPAYFAIQMVREPVISTSSVDSIPGAEISVPLVQIKITTKAGLDITQDRDIIAPVGNVYTLMDVAETSACAYIDAPSMREDKLVLFSAACSKVNRKVAKCGALTYYMPLWTLAELQEANTALGLELTDSMVAERYCKIGGIARYVFMRHPASFNQYISRDLVDKAAALQLTDTTNLSAATTFTERKAHLLALAYIFVTYNGPGAADYTFTSGEMCWGTKNILVEVIAATWLPELTQHIRGFTYTHTSRETQYSHISAMTSHRVSYLYEGCVLRRLQLGGLHGMKWQCGGRSGNSRFMAAFGDGRSFRGPFDILYCEPEEMATRVRTAPPRTLIVPTSFQYPAINCVMKATSVTDGMALYVCIQVTVAHSRALSPADETFFVTFMDAVYSDVAPVYRNRHIRDRSAIFCFIPPLQYASFALPQVTNYPGRLVKLTLE